MIQAGVNPDKAKSGFPPIALERTNKTGLLHKDGVISMARGMPDSATSGWFICINDQPSLDFGGMRNPDGQGFAAFGRVVSGMDVVRKIQMAPSSADRKTNTEAQSLTPPIKIIKVARVSAPASPDRSRERPISTFGCPMCGWRGRPRIVAVAAVAFIQSRRANLTVADVVAGPAPFDCAALAAGRAVTRGPRIDFLGAAPLGPRSGPTIGRSSPTSRSPISTATGSPTFSSPTRPRIA